ncbi:MAG: cation:proton antiporter, partial [Bacteroidota bacterium]
SGEGMEFSGHALIAFFQIVLIGMAAGTLAAIGLKQLIQRNQVPHYLLNVFTLATVLTVFVLCDILAPESGLLGVVVMGMAMGNMDVPKLKDILDFKESLSVLLISILFILLAANIDMEDLLLLRNWKVVLLFAIVVFVLRPLGVLLSTRDSDLNFNEKLFISWVGPRGIVAAGIASLFGIRLMSNGTPQAEYITPLVFMIVLGTVLLNATTARLVARLLGVIQEKSSGVMIVGSNIASRLVGNYLKNNQRHVILVDNNNNSLRKAENEGLETLLANIYSDDLNEYFELTDMGYIFAMTSSHDVNEHAIRRFGETIGENGTYRLASSEEIKKTKSDLPADGLIVPGDDFINLVEVVRDYPAIHEMELESKEQFTGLMKNINRLSRSIPIFVKRANGSIDVISAHFEKMEIEKGD